MHWTGFVLCFELKDQESLVHFLVQPHIAGHPDAASCRLAFDPSCVKICVTLAASVQSMFVSRFNFCTLQYLFRPSSSITLKGVETTALNKHGDNCQQSCFVREVAELAQADFGVFVVRTLLKHPFVDAEVQ